MTHAVAASEFCRKFGTFQRKAQGQPIEVQNHGSVTGYFISPEDFQTYQRLLAESRQALHPSELPPHLREAIAEARMDSRHDSLNSLMDDE
jgi:hypothetical protein